MKHMKKMLALALVVMSVMAIAVPAMAADMYGATIAVPSGQTLNLRQSPGGTILYQPRSGETVTVDSNLANPPWIIVTSYQYMCYGMRKYIDTSTVSNPSVSYLLGSSGNLAQSSTEKAAVYNLQWILKRLGYNPGTVDGIFGSNTKAAVEEFQRDYGLDDDGIVGPLTKAELIDALD